MPMLRKKAGPKFEAMEFDGSFECAKEIITWSGEGFQSQGAYWSSNKTMTFPWADDDHKTYRAGDFIVKMPGGLYRIDGAAFDYDYEAVS